MDERKRLFISRRITSSNLLISPVLVDLLAAKKVKSICSFESKSVKVEIDYDDDEYLIHKMRVINDGSRQCYVKVERDLDQGYQDGFFDTGTHEADLPQTESGKFEFVKRIHKLDGITIRCGY